METTKELDVICQFCGSPMSSEIGEVCPNKDAHWEKGLSLLKFWARSGGDAVQRCIKRLKRWGLKYDQETIDEVYKSIN